MKNYIALIDDDAEFGKILQVVLKRLGVELGVFTNSDDFFHSLSKRVPDLTLLDLNLSELGEGFKVIEQFRKRLGHKAILFVVSANMSAQSVAHALEIGANDYILKPLDKELFAAKLIRYVKSDELRDYVEDHSYEVPADDRSGQLLCNLEIEAVDEIGIRLAGPHLITKGTAVKISGPILQEWSKENSSLLLTVTSTWINQDDQTHGAYAEFDPHNDVLISNVRKWLSEIA